MLCFHFQIFEVHLWIQFFWLSDVFFLPNVVVVTGSVVKRFGELVGVFYFSVVDSSALYTSFASFIWFMLFSTFLSSFSSFLAISLSFVAIRCIIMRQWSRWCTGSSHHFYFRFTRVNVKFFGTVLANNFAAPMKLAVTVLHSPDPPSVVTPPAAKMIAPVFTFWRFVAFPPTCSQRPWKTKIFDDWKFRVLMMAR